MNPVPTRRSHPLYVIPVEYAKDDGVRRLLFEDQSIVLDELASGELEIYATSLPDGTYFLIDAGYGDEESNLRDFAQPYTPTPKEVMRALRGPQGETGPMGPQGDRGESRKCECLEMDEEIANIPLPDPFMTKEKVYNLPILPDETDLSTKDFVDLSYSLEDQADESSTTLYRAILTWHEGVRGMTHFTLPRTTKAEAVRSARVARSQGRHDWSTVYEYREPGGNWTRFIPNETSVSMEARTPEKRNVVFGYWGRKS